MTLKEFLSSVGSESEPPAEIPDTLKALWWAEKGDWERAHMVAQDISTADGSWIHANLHREEGDPGNARYWYNRAGKPESSVSVEEERRAIIAALL